MKFTAEYVRWIQLISQHVLSMNTPINTHEGLDIELGDSIIDEGPTLEELAIQEDLKRIIAEIMNDTLNEREKRVIISRFGFESRPMTLQEVGETLNLTRERIRQIEATALKKIKRALSRYNITANDI